MKALNTYINEKLILNKDTFKKHYNYFPKTKEELKDIIKQLIKERKNKKVIDLNDIDTSKITEMRGLFYNLPITEIDISGWDVSNVTDMSTMFFECEKLESIRDLNNWDVSKVKYMTYMFYYCRKLKDIGDISTWNVSNVKNMNKMFTGSGITNIPSWYKN
jgi:surface protein